MNIDLNKYVTHYFEPGAFIQFFLLTFVLLAVSYMILYLYTKFAKRTKPKEMVGELQSLSDRFHEIIFSATSIILFITAYYLIDRFVLVQPFRGFWDKYNDFILLFMMVVSILFNTFLDHVLVKLKSMDREEMASIRLLGMLYMMIIFAYIKFIYENNNYDRFIAYFLTLMVGRFVYFDASFKEFLENIKRAAKSIPLMLMVLSYTGLLCWYGYATEYLLKHNGVITNVFFVHLFMVVCIWILHKIPVIILKNKLKRRKKEKLEERNKAENPQDNTAMKKTAPQRRKPVYNSEVRQKDEEVILESVTLYEDEEEN